MADDALTLEEFEARLDVKDGRVHTFMNPAGMLVGAHWSLEQALECAKRHGATLAGEQATAMKHGVVVIENGNPVFFATKAQPEA